MPGDRTPSASTGDTGAVASGNSAESPPWVTGCRADGVSGTDGLPSIAEGRCPAPVTGSKTPTSGPTRAAGPHGRIVPLCMARPRGARWRLRSTNVRAATMYSASKWSICSGPSWVSARIRDLLPERPQGPKWHPVSWLRRADRLSISSFHLADLGGEAVDVFVLHSCRPRYRRTGNTCDEIASSHRLHRTQGSRLIRVSTWTIKTEICDLRNGRR